MNTKKTDSIVVWFGALCFFLSTIEYMIPKPLPFLRLGLANLPIMLAIDILPFPSFCILIMIKVLGQGLIGGTLFSYIFLFSAAGTLSSACVMFLLKKVFSKSVSYIGISVAGAFASNAAQLILARWYIFGESAWYIAPPFLVVGAISGTLLGVFANHFSKKSRWYAAIRSGTLQMLECSNAEAGPFAGKSSAGFTRSVPFRFSIGLLMLLSLMFAKSLTIQVGIALFAVFLVFFDHGRISILPVATMTLSIVLFNLFVPFGKVLCTPLGFPVTEGALILGIKKALTMEGMVFISRWMLLPGFRLLAKQGRLLSQAFVILGHLSGGRKKIDPKNLIASLDSIMFELD